MANVIPAEYRQFDINELTEHPGNPRIGPVAAIEQSIADNGFFGAIVVQKSSNRILIGNHRYRAAIAQGIILIPALVIDVDDERAMRILLADNRIAEFAEWNDDELRGILTELSETPSALAGTGFSVEDLAKLINPDRFEPEDEANRIDVYAAHECPLCGGRWRVDSKGNVVDE